MFAPRVAKSTSVLPRRSAISQAQLLQTGASNQAMSRHTVLDASAVRNEPAIIQRENNVDPMAGCRVQPSWDFSQVPVFLSSVRPNLQPNLQPRLQPSDVNDPLEHEADRMADRVMLEPVSSASPGFNPTQTPWRRDAREPAASNAQSDYASPIVRRILSSPGQALDASTRAFFEPRFHRDLSQVRIHTDAAAASSARSIDALAYTSGRRIVFAQGQLAPHTDQGRRLLAHELAHTEQNISAADPARVYRQRAHPGASAPAPAPLKGLSRTLYVVNNDVWNALPAQVKASAEKELGTLFEFVGKASGEKPFSIKIVTPADLPEQFDFSESVVTVMRGDPSRYVEAAFNIQAAQIKDWMAQHHEQAPAQTLEAKTSDPDRIGTGVASKTVKKDHSKSFAMPILAGAVDIDMAINTFFDNSPSMLEDLLKKLPANGRDVTKWPQTVTSTGGSFSWQPLVMFGEELGRLIAHEARHEYIQKHAEKGLGQQGAIPIGEKGSEEFSKKDQKDILKRIQTLEHQQGRATIVPTFPKDKRSKSDPFPF